MDQDVGQRFVLVESLDRFREQGSQAYYSNRQRCLLLYNGVCHQELSGRQRAKPFSS